MVLVVGMLAGIAMGTEQDSAETPCVAA